MPCYVPCKAEIGSADIGKRPASQGLMHVNQSVQGRTTSTVEQQSIQYRLLGLHCCPHDLSSTEREETARPVT